MFDRRTALALILLFSTAPAIAWGQQRAPAQRPFGGVRAAPAPAAPAAPAAAAPAVVEAVASKADELAIRQTADAAGKAFNAGDAKNLAALFTADGETIDSDGVKAQGREQIEQVFARLFAAHPGSQIEIAIESIRFLSPTVAVEEGRSAVSDPATRSVDRNRYRAIHVKLADKRWLMASVSDFADKAAAAKNELEELAWLVGQWVEEGPGGVVASTYNWTDNQAYLVSEFTVQVSGRPTMNGTQRIAWDPLEKKIHSWVFDSRGGFAEGLWTRQGNKWVVKLEGVNRDGSPSSATHILARLSQDRYSWQSRDRVVGDEVEPDSPEVIVVRRPPGPEMADLPKK